DVLAEREGIGAQEASADPAAAHRHERAREAVAVGLETQPHLERAHDDLARGAVLVDADLDAADEAPARREPHAAVDAVEAQPVHRVEAPLVDAAERAPRQVAHDRPAAPL